MHRRRMLQTLVIQNSPRTQCGEHREKGPLLRRGGSTGLALDKMGATGSTVGGAGVDRKET